MSGMRNVYPTKKDLNLAQKERSGHGLGPAALEALFLAVLVGLFCRFGVINVIAKAAAAESAAGKTAFAHKKYLRLFRDFVIVPKKRFQPFQDVFRRVVVGDLYGQFIRLARKRAEF